jgi:hypothetical protein
MKRLIGGGTPILAAALLLAGAAPVHAQMCPFGMRAQVQMQMQWQVQAHQQQYAMTMQQQAMHALQMHMHTQTAMHHTMQMNRQVVPPQHLVHFQNVSTPHVVHNFRPVVHTHQTNHVTAQVSLEHQTHLAQLTRMHIIHPTGHGPGIAHPHVSVTHQTVAQHRVVPQIHLHQHTTQHLTTHLQHEARIVHVNQPRRHDIHQPGQQHTTVTHHTTATTKTQVSVTAKHKPPAKHEEHLTHTDTHHKASLKIRMSVTMTCGNCHVTAPQRPTLVLNPPRAPNIVALVPPILPDFVLGGGPMPPDLVAAKPRPKKPQGPGKPDRIPAGDDKPLRRIPARDLPGPNGIPAGGTNDTATTMVGQPSLPSLSSGSTSSSMKSVDQLTSWLSPKSAASPGTIADVARPPALPPLAGEIMQVALQPAGTEVTRSGIVAGEEPLVPDDLLTHPPLPALVPPGPSFPMEMAVAKMRTPSLAETVAQAPPLPLLRP